MGHIQYAFDPTRGLYELRDLFDLLHRYYPEVPDNPRKFSGQNNESDDEKERQIRQLNSEIKKYQAENEKNFKKIEGLTTDNESLKKELKETKEEAETYARLNEEDKTKHQEELERLVKEKEKAISESEKQFQIQNEALMQEKDKQIKILNQRVKELTRKVEVYEPSIGTDISENIYFNVYLNTLEQTYSSDAPFVGKVDKTGNAIFQFNVENGPHKEYSQNPEKFKDFCDIIDIPFDGANHVAIDEWGKGQFNRGTLSVKQKAKVRLIKE